MQRLLTVCFFFCVVRCVAAHSGPSQIIWVSHNATDAPPEQCVLDVGLNEAPDKAYTDLLSQFVEVVRYETGSELTPENLEILNNADLVIIGRAVSSSDYLDSDETEFWNTQVTSPIIMMSGYITRANRLAYFDGTTIVHTDDAVKLEAVQPDHPVFEGIGLDDWNVMTDNFSDGLVDFGLADPLGLQRGITINDDEVVGGEVIATISSDAGIDNGVMIAEWDQGAILYNGEQTAGRRMLFLSGSREANGLCVPGAGGYDLTDVGQQLFLNAVEYMGSQVPEPATIALAGISLLAGYRRLVMRRLA